MEGKLRVEFEIDLADFPKAWLDRKAADSLNENGRIGILSRINAIDEGSGYEPVRPENIDISGPLTDENMELWIPDSFRRLGLPLPENWRKMMGLDEDES